MLALQSVVVALHFLIKSGDFLLHMKGQVLLLLNVVCHEFNLLLLCIGSASTSAMVHQPSIS